MTCRRREYWLDQGQFNNYTYPNDHDNMMSPYKEGYAYFLDTGIIKHNSLTFEEISDAYLVTNDSHVIYTDDVYLNGQTCIVGFQSTSFSDHTRFDCNYKSRGEWMGIDWEGMYQSG